MAVGPVGLTPKQKPAAPETDSPNLAAPEFMAALPRLLLPRAPSENGEEEGKG